jgi:hypothetical protein
LKLLRQAPRDREEAPDPNKLRYVMELLALIVIFVSLAGGDGGGKAGW